MADLVSLVGGSADVNLSVAKGDIQGTTHVNKFGRNPDIDTGSVPEDIWAQGGLWTPPTSAQIHDVASSSANDVGSILASGFATGGSTTTLEDAGATFASNGVTPGDTILDDTTLEHSTIISVTETVLTCHVTRHGTAFNAGDAYRIVSPASTGASVVHVFGLDSNMNEISEFVVLNGVGLVPTLNQYWRIFRCHIDGAANRSVSNDGDVTGTAQIDATVSFKVAAGFGTTALAIYTIPAGKTGYMTQFYADINRQGGTSGAMADLTLRTTPFASIDGAGSRVEHYFGLAVDGSSSYRHEFKPYKVFEEQTDIWIRCEDVTDNNTDISAGFDIILVDN